MSMEIALILIGYTVAGLAVGRTVYWLLDRIDWWEDPADFPYPLVVLVWPVACFALVLVALCAAIQWLVTKRWAWPVRVSAEERSDDTKNSPKIDEVG